MTKLFKNKKLVIILSIVLAVVLAAGVGILVWQLTKDDDSTYTINFVTNGGNEIEALQVKKGTVLSQAELPVPSKRGEMFLSWYTDEALSAPYWDSSIESDMTLYASYIQPVNDETVNELVESVIPFASTDFSVTVCSSVELTNENVEQYIMLTINYGEHENGEPIQLSVTHEGENIYRISGNYAPRGEYILTLMSDEITFNPEDTTLAAFGLTDALRELQFRIVGEAYVDGELSGSVAAIPEGAAVLTDSDSVTISGGNQQLIGATEEENAIVRVGEGEDISNYYKILAIEAETADSITYSVRPAKVEEVYDTLSGYQWENLDGDDLVINEEVLEQVKENIANNEQLNNYVKYLALASTHTSTYETMSMEQFGEVVSMPLATVVSPSGITLGLDFDAYNDNFNFVLDEDKRDGFVKMTLGIEYAVKLAKVGSKGTITAQVNMQIDFWIYVGVGGHFEIGWGEYDIACGMMTLTQTEITFAISLMTSDAKKAVNINDEIEAIYNSAKEPTPENLLEQYNELMSGSSKPIELFNKEIFEMPILSLLYGAVEISIPVNFVVSLDMEATFSSYFTVLSGNEIELRGDEDSGLDLKHNRIPDRYKYRIELRGHIGVRAGVEASLKLSLAYNLASVSVGVQVGFYGDIYGYFFYERDRMNFNGYYVDNQGGAYYFELGTYIDVRIRAEICKIKYSGSLWDKKFPQFSVGDKEILYGFVNPTGDVITLDNYQRSVCIDDTGILDVYLYDITEPRSDKNPRRVDNYPFKVSDFDLSLSNDSFKIKFNEIIFNDSSLNGIAFEATLIMNYTDSQLAFRDTLTKYVTIRFSFDDDVDWENLDETYTVDFTIDGEVIFSRNYSYGSTICFRPSGDRSYYLNMHLEHYMYKDKLITNLRENEREALYNAGYAEARWYLMKTEENDDVEVVGDTDVIMITKDMTIEAKDMVKRRPWNVTLTENGKTTEYQVNHEDQLTLPSPTENIITTISHIHKFVGWKAKDGTIYSTSQAHTITSDLDLTPHYVAEKITYAITFDGNGAILGNDGETTFGAMLTFGEIPEYPFTPQREATDTARYEFIGWSPAITMAIKDVTYTAQWKEIKRYTVTFDAGEGQFDKSGNKTVSIIVDEGHVLTSDDLPTNPYTKAEGGYYEFEAWSDSVVGTVVDGNIIYSASYKDELTAATGIIISDGVNSEDIAAYLDGSNKIDGYTYTLSTEYYGNTLEISGSGLTISGEAEDIHIQVADSEITLHELTLTQNSRAEIIGVSGDSVLNISGAVSLTCLMDGEAIRGDEGNMTIRGVGTGSKLTVNGQAYGIAVYGALTIENLEVEVNMPEVTYEDQESGIVYSVVAIMVHNHPRGTLTVTNSDIVVNNGVVNVAWLIMTDSNLTFTAEEFVPGYSSGIDIMNYREITEPEALIVLTNSHISFTHDIAIAFSVSLEDGTSYFVNTSMEEIRILGTYPTLEALIADTDANAYKDIISIDGNSSIA